MGAWGSGSFENDTALDWLYDLEEEGVTLVRTALEDVTEADTDDYLDADDCSSALAAAEIVAAAMGRGSKALPDDVAGWLKVHAKAITDQDATLARRAVTRVRDRSELQELWDENGPDNEWHREVAGLLGRLAGKAAATAKTASADDTDSEAPAAPKKKVAAKKPAAAAATTKKKKPAATAKQPAATTKKAAATVKKQPAAATKKKPAAKKNK